MVDKTDYDFVNVSLKKDIADKITQICDDSAKYNIFISKSELLDIMLNDPIVIEYAIKKWINNKKAIIPT
jgi:hypothetical protein